MNSRISSCGVSTIRTVLVHGLEITAVQCEVLGIFTRQYGVRLSTGRDQDAAGLEPELGRRGPHDPSPQPDRRHQPAEDVPDVVDVQAGGAGYGDPAARDAEAIAADFADGKIVPAGSQSSHRV